MLQGPLRFSILSGALAFGAAGVALALASAGVPFLIGALLAAAAAGLVAYAAQRDQSTVAVQQDTTLQDELEAFRVSTAGMRHDIRGVLSPALMVSDRLLNHTDPAVQRAGQAVVKSVEKATALLATNKTTLDTGQQTIG